MAMRGEISMLAPAPKDKEERRAWESIRDVVRKIVVNAAIHRPNSDLMVEVYAAGLYHCHELGQPPPRKPDYLEIDPAPRRRRTRRV